MKEQTAMNQLVEWIKVRTEQLNSDQILHKKNDEYVKALSCLEQTTALLDVYSQIIPLLSIEQNQIEAAHHDGYIQAGEDGYRSEHGPRVHNPVSSEQYYTDKYGTE